MPLLLLAGGTALAALFFSGKAAGEASAQEELLKKYLPSTASGTSSDELSPLTVGAIAVIGIGTILLIRRQS